MRRVIADPLRIAPQRSGGTFAFGLCSVKSDIPSSGISSCNV
jgi:hypothetical protein